VRTREERGTATVFALVFVGLLATVAVLGAAVAAVLVGQRQAAAAADLAALAGASAVQDGGAACPAAEQIAERNRAGLRECAVSGDVVTVEVTLAVRSVFRSEVQVRARARAGPVG
jgi:secretion/DNA translocation related TadE-like protein